MYTSVNAEEVAYSTLRIASLSARAQMTALVSVTSPLATPCERTGAALSLTEEKSESTHAMMVIHG
jgi:hypothetical protein